MKRFLYLSLAVVVLASCSARKYTYHFDTYDYNSGRKTAHASREEASPLGIGTETFSADASPVIGPLSEVRTMHNQVSSTNEPREAFVKKYSDMSKVERKDFRKEVKEQMKSYAKAIKNGDGINATDETAVMDNDLKLAIIFGAVGLTLSLFAGISEAFWILGVIAIVVGVVFLIKWLVRQ